MRIVFMGTPGFAVASLKKLHESSHEIVAVVTAPDKPAGRGKKMQQSAVKQYALEQNLPVLQPEKLKSEEFIKKLQDNKPELIAVVAFRMLPQAVWALPPKGTINLHASLLPDYRGAAPINWAIINGEKETGATTFFINENIDTGAIIDSVRIPIAPDDTAGSLHDNLMHTGADLLLKTVNDIEANRHRSSPQPEVKNLKTAPKIFKDDTRLHFNAPAASVYNRIRGLSPYPGAFAVINGTEKPLTVKIYSTSIGKKNENIDPGTIATDNRNYWRVACNDAWLELKEVQLPGKRRMKVPELLNGFQLEKGAKMR